MTAKLDGPTRASAINAARIGVSFEGIAHLCGYSRSHFKRIRAADPDFNTSLLRAMAEHETGLAAIADESIRSDNASLHAAALKGLAQRYPQRHSADPRIRLSAVAAAEGYDEDLEDPTQSAPADSTAAVISRLVERMLSEDENV